MLGFIINDVTNGNSDTNRPQPVDATHDTGATRTSDNNLGNRNQSDGDGSDQCVTFTVWKGEEANEALRAAAKVSGCDKDFIKTMTAENGSWNLYMKHPIRNNNGTWDYSMGLNDAYHTPFIQKILAREVTPEQIMSYHYEIYKERKGAFYGYYKRNNANVLKLLKFT